MPGLDKETTMTQTKKNLNTTNSTYGCSDEAYALWYVAKAVAATVAVTKQQDGEIPVLDDGPVVRMIRKAEEERTEVLEKEEHIERVKVGKKVELRSDMDHMRASAKVDKRYAHLKPVKRVQVKETKVAMGTLALALQKAGLK
jgi:hypothetical protein